MPATKTLHGPARGDGAGGRGARRRCRGATPTGRACRRPWPRCWPTRRRPTRAAAALGDADELIAFGRGYLMAGGARGRAQAARGRGRARRGLVGGRLPPRPGHRGARRHPGAGRERGGARPRRTWRSWRRGSRRGERHGAAAGRPRRAPTCPTPARLPEPLRALPAVVRAQQLALALALRRGIDPDEPPGLSKVTATE